MVLKRQEFQKKHHEKSFKNLVCRKVKIMAFKTLPRVPVDMLGNEGYTTNIAATYIHIASYPCKTQNRNA